MNIRHNRDRQISVYDVVFAVVVELGQSCSSPYAHQGYDSIEPRQSTMTKTKQNE